MSTHEVEVPAAARVAVSTRTRAGLAVAGSAAGLGILGDALLRSAPWGLNLALWTAALVACCAALQRLEGAEDSAGAWMPLAVGVAVLMAWRDSPTLKALDLAALGILLGLAMMRARGGQLRLAGLAHHAAGVAVSAADAAVGAGKVLADDIRWGELRGGGRTRVAMAAARGAVIAIPLLLLFGSLLAAADASFQRVVGRVFAVDAAEALMHVMMAAAVAWVAAGILRTLTLGGGSPGPEPARPAWLAMGTVEAGVVLGLLNVLFLAFVAVQVPYFFGSGAMLRAPGTVTFAEYARRGFFELVTVAALVLPMLLAADWIVLRRGARQERVFRMLAGAMVALLFVIMASALHRMRLYWGAYGLTELRLYTTAFMGWLGIVFGLFAWTVLRGRRERFAFGALVAALEVVAVLHVVNPDGLIVRVNAGRDDAATGFDARYAATLSADAVPPLVAALTDGVGADRCHAADRLLRRWDGDGDWRSWSVSRGRAEAAVARNRAALRAMACAPPPSRAEPYPASAYGAAAP